jgi:hypothetical protein
MWSQAVWIDACDVFSRLCTFLLSSYPPFILSSFHPFLLSSDPFVTFSAGSGSAGGAAAAEVAPAAKPQGMRLFLSQIRE